jgi:hypothetical protein
MPNAIARGMATVEETRPAMMSPRCSLGLRYDFGIYDLGIYDLSILLRARRLGNPAKVHRQIRAQNETRARQATFFVVTIHGAAETTGGRK